MASTEAENLIPQEFLATSPSLKDGKFLNYLCICPCFLHFYYLPLTTKGVQSGIELRHRIFGCEIIQEAGILLKQPQVVMATAQNILHRFFYRFD